MSGENNLTSKSILVSELTHASLVLLQAKLQVLDKKKYSMNVIIDKLLNVYQGSSSFDPLQTFKLVNIET